MNNNITITNHNPQDITITQQDNQLILVNGGGEVIGITDVRVNGTSVVTNNIAYVIVPTKTSELTNDSGFITTETDPTVPSYVKAITLADINNWNNKQNALVSGSTIKTINNETLLGSGNINIEGNVYTAGTGINIDANNEISNTITSYDDLSDLPTIPTKTSDLLNDSDFVSSNTLADVAFSGSYVDLSNTPTIPDSTSQLVNDSDFIDSTDLSTGLATKQNTLISGTNIKTINGVSVLGAGDIIVTGGASYTAGTGIDITSNVISNKSQIYSSTNETAIGTWIDNSTLYQKVIPVTLASGTNTTIDVSSLNISEIISFDGTLNGISFNFYMLSEGVGYFMSTRYYNGSIYFTYHSAYGGASGNLIIKYTKST